MRRPCPGCSCAAARLDGAADARLAAAAAQVGQGVDVGIASGRACARAGRPRPSASRAGSSRTGWRPRRSRPAAGHAGGRRRPASPSTVVTSLPARVSMLRSQASARLPSTSTVQAPQVPLSQPYLVPVRCSTSRRYHSSGMPGSPTCRKVSPLMTQCDARARRNRGDGRRAGSGRVGLARSGASRRRWCVHSCRAGPISGLNRCFHRE